jgi:hypothetical protein
VILKNHTVTCHLQTHLGGFFSHPIRVDYRARIFNRLWSPGIDSKELIPPAYRFLAPIDSLKIPAQDTRKSTNEKKWNYECVSVTIFKIKRQMPKSNPTKLCQKEGFKK